MTLFVVVSVFYTVTLMGNTTIILLSHLDPHLHTPMYFFLAHLSILDLCFTTSCIPQILVNFWGSDKTISYLGCEVQLYIFLGLGAAQCVLLLVMAFNRLCGSVSTPALCSNHVPKPVSQAGIPGLGKWNFWHLGTVSYHHETPLLPPPPG